MAKEKETSEPKENSEQANPESEEKKSAAQKENATEKKKAQGAGKPPKSQKTGSVPETAGTEEIQAQEDRKTAASPADISKAGEPETSPSDEPIAVVPAGEPAATEGGASDAYGPPPQEPESDPIKTFGIYAGVAFLILIVLIVGTSMQNMRKYYVISRNGAVEIWKGSFSPMGRQRLLVMPGIQPLDSTKEVYSKQDVYPLISQYYLDKADALMDVPGSPNFEELKGYLNQALQYATTAEMRNRVHSRIQTIDRLTLLYKADVAAGRGSLEGYRTALAFLQQAEALNPDEIEANLIREKIQSIEKQISALDQKQAETQDQAPSPGAEKPSAGAGDADQKSTAPQSPESGKSSSEQAGSTEEPVDF